MGVGRNACSPPAAPLFPRPASVECRFMPPKPRQGPPRKRTDSSGAIAGIDRRLVAIAAAGVLILVAVILGITLSGGGADAAAGGEGEARTALEAAGCELKLVAALKGADHSITDPDGIAPSWNTDPPTSGPHYAETLIYGSYSEPIQQARALHNLEHGAITIQYGSKVPKPTVEELQGFYDQNTNGTILAPYPTLGKKIALAAWNAANPSDPGTGVVATCTTFDQAAYEAFFDAFQFKGPERFEPNAMLPGSN